MGSLDDSLFLCARPSFLEGMSRVLDFGNCLNEYNGAPTGAQADYLAISGDWRLIGLDWNEAIREIDADLAE
jgi:hypothetical protein